LQLLIPGHACCKREQEHPDKAALGYSQSHRIISCRGGHWP
jgi:hypothetical protein